MLVLQTVVMCLLILKYILIQITVIFDLEEALIILGFKASIYIFNTYILRLTPISFHFFNTLTLRFQYID